MEKFYFIWILDKILDIIIWMTFLENDFPWHDDVVFSVDECYTHRGQEIVSI